MEPLGGHSVLRVQVAPSAVPVAYQGRYYRRVGNTTREISPGESGRFFIARLGIKWDGIPEAYSLEEFDEETLRRFVRMAQARLPYLSAQEPTESLLRKLGLFEDGRPTRGAMLLFGVNPQRYFLMAEIHMGRFKDGITIVDDKLLKGNLFQQLDGAMQTFRQYLQVRYEMPKEMGERAGAEAMQRREIWDYPLESLREAVINALIHRDYFQTSGDIQIRVYDDRVAISNPGGLPEDMTVEELKREFHRSVLRNPLLAQVFYYANLIEKWGSGTWRMIELCREQGLPEPEFRADPNWFYTIFAKDPYTEERLRQMGLSERQVGAVLYVKEKGSINNKEYQGLTEVSKPTATRDLDGLVKRGIFVKKGRTGRGTRYQLKGSTRTQTAHEGLDKDSNGSGEKGHI